MGAGEQGLQELEAGWAVGTQVQGRNGEGGQVTRRPSQGSLLALTMRFLLHWG